jgi:hypothetical protein
MKKSILFLLLSITGLINIGCDSEFQEFNTNDYEVTPEQIEYDGYNVQSSLISMQGYIVPTGVNLNQFTDCLLGGSYGGYFSDSNKGFVGRNFATYSADQVWTSIPFNDIIGNLFPSYILLQSLTKDQVILSVANIVKVAAIHRITDIYGHIPYSEIGKNGELTAKYDLQEDVYKHMLKELDDAIKYLTENQNLDFSANADNIFDGKVIKWIKYANSLKLRLALRISYASPELAKTKAEEVAKHEIGTMSSNEDNAYNKVSKSPFRVVMYDYNGGDSRISADITSYMNGYDDPRREKYFTLSTFPDETNGYIGLRSGINFSSSETAHLYSNYQIDEKEDKMLLMNCSESAFLKAEAALRGWDMGETAQYYYNKGIELSFEQWGANGANTYMENSTNVPSNYVDPKGANSYNGTPKTITIKWDETAEFEENLERIITQKWIAGFPLGINAWSEFRRTNYPRLMEAPHNLSNGIIKDNEMANRLPYPEREYLENIKMLQFAIDNLGGDDNLATKVWWDKKNDN